MKCTSAVFSGGHGSVTRARRVDLADGFLMSCSPFSTDNSSMNWTRPAPWTPPSRAATLALRTALATALGAIGEETSLFATGGADSTNPGRQGTGFGRKALGRLRLGFGGTSEAVGRRGGVLIRLGMAAQKLTDSGAIRRASRCLFLASSLLRMLLMVP